MKNSIVFVFCVATLFGLFVTGLPVDKAVDATTTPESLVASDDNDTLNGTHKELYVIKAVVYEIGILADVPDDDNTTDDGPVTHQQVDLTFYDTDSNSSFINFGDIPLPVQTNVSGQIITGIAPVHIGALHNVSDILQNLPFSGTIVNITESNTSFFQLSRENVTEAEQEIHLGNNSNLSQLPILNDVLLPDSFDEAYNSVKSSEV